MDGWDMKHGELAYWRVAIWWCVESTRREKQTCTHRDTGRERVDDGAQAHASLGGLSQRHDGDGGLRDEILVVRLAHGHHGAALRGGAVGDGRLRGLQ